MEKQDIFFVDDDLSVRNSVGAILYEDGFTVTCFATGRRCLKELRSKKCDLLVVDVRMPDMNGIDLLRQAKHIKPWTPALIITGYGDVPTTIRAFKAGAIHFIEKPFEMEVFLTAVRDAIGTMAFSSPLLGIPLTAMEMRVLDLTFEGHSNQEAARLLDRSKRTVEVFRSRIMSKLGVDNVVDLVKRSVQMGLVELDTPRRPDERGANSRDISDNKASGRVFLLDDDPSILKAGSETLEETGFTVTRFSESSRCLEELQSKKCDLLVAELRMPDMDGIYMLREAKRIKPWMAALIITGRSDVPTAVRAFEAGAVGFIEKPVERHSFLAAVMDALGPMTSSNRFLDQPLTRAEMRVLRLILKAHSSKEISRLLHRSERTIEVHRRHIMGKLGVSNIVDLVKRSAEMGLVKLETPPRARGRRANPHGNRDN
ncbi:MAG: response regulator [Phycisphaerae bacterium]|nr:response regulator [Phycisphaerae bacterium]